MKAKKSPLHFFKIGRHFWITMLLLVGNGLAWNAAVITNLPQPEPILHPEIAAIRDN